MHVFNELQKVSYKSMGFLKRNSSTILTGLGAVGVVGTAVATAKATTKASRLLDEIANEKGEDLTVYEKVRIAAPIYIPAILLGVSTISCIFGANALNKRYQASLVSAYTVLDQSYKEYKTKVGELFGEDADRQVRHEIAKEKRPRR